MNLLIKNGLIIDGTGKKPFKADIAVERDRIIGIGSFNMTDARNVVDASGLTVTPGLIDGHTHAELNLMRNRQYPNAIYQGVSTIVTGQCGLGFAPIRPEQFEDSIKVNGGIFSDYRKFLLPWESFGQFLSRMDGAAINAAANVSHNAVRQYSLGFSDKPLKGNDLDIACGALESAMQQGAVGLSVGLSYYPGGYSDTQELINLCKVVKKYDGVFCVHLRINDHQIPTTPVEEIAEVVRQTGVRLNMLHYRTGGMEDISVLYAPFRELEAQGAEIHYEYYPYMVGAGLVLAFVPGWVQEGGYTQIMERLTDPSIRKKLLQEMDERHQYFFAEGQTATVTLTKDPYSKDLGRTFAEIQEETGESFNEMVLRLLIENELEVGFAGVENQSIELKDKLYDDQYKLFTDDRYTVGSDSIPAGILCHPRAFGTFPRVIKQMRVRNVPSEYVIKKLTSWPAKIYHLKDRGILAEGMKADICIMDYQKVGDTATFSDPRQKPEGIKDLYVNGLPAMKNGTITGILGGHALERDK